MASTRLTQYDDSTNKNPIIGLENCPIVELVVCFSLLKVNFPEIFDTLSFENAIYAALQHAGNIAKFQKQFKLTPDLSGILNLYTQEGPVYKEVNKALRAEDRNNLKPWFAFLNMFLIALAMLEPLMKLLFRGVKKAFEEIAGNFKVGMTFTWFTITSATSNMGILNKEDFLGETAARVLFVINACHCYDISAFSAFPQEAEFILPINSDFSIDSILKQGPLLTIINLTQLPYRPLVRLPPHLAALKNGIKATIDLTANLSSMQVKPAVVKLAALNGAAVATVEKFLADLEQKGSQAPVVVLQHLKRSGQITVAKLIEAALDDLQLHCPSIQVERHSWVDSIGWSHTLLCIRLRTGHYSGWQVRDTRPGQAHGHFFLVAVRSPQPIATLALMGNSMQTHGHVVRYDKQRDDSVTVVYYRLYQNGQHIQVLDQKLLN